MWVASRRGLSLFDPGRAVVPPWALLARSRACCAEHRRSRRPDRPGGRDHAHARGHRDLQPVHPLDEIAVRGRVRRVEQDPGGGAAPPAPFHPRPARRGHAARDRRSAEPRAVRDALLARSPWDDPRSAVSADEIALIGKALVRAGTSAEPQRRSNVTEKANVRPARRDVQEGEGGSRYGRLHGALLPWRERSGAPFLGLTCTCARSRWVKWPCTDRRRRARADRRSRPPAFDSAPKYPSCSPLSRRSTCRSSTCWFRPRPCRR